MSTKNTAIWGIIIVLTAMILVSTVKFRSLAGDKISVTGLGETEFVSDLIVWQGTLTCNNNSLEAGYNEIERQRKIVQEYIMSQGIADSCVVFSFINNYERQKPIYGGNGQYVGTAPDGYSFNQEIKIESAEVDKVEELSRNISVLFSKGVNIQSQAPSYYYSKLEGLKLDIIATATKDARSRAETIAKKSKSKVGQLASAKMGVFQIVAPNSNEAYSWGGNYNTSSKNKKASITMKLEYHIK